MVAYATVQDVQDLGMFPSDELAQYNTSFPTVIPALIEACSAVADSYLRKRYQLPLVTPYPRELVYVVVQLVVHRIYLKRGVVATTDVANQIVDEKNAAMKWLDDVSRGLVELDINADATPAKDEGGPVYGQLGSPYSWYDQNSGSGGYGNWGPKNGCC